MYGGFSLSLHPLLLHKNLQLHKRTIYKTIAKEGKKDMSALT